MRRALVVGSRGQDGTLLVEALVARGDVVVGVDIGVVEPRGLAGEALPSSVSLVAQANVDALIGPLQPDAVYYLAAHHHSSEGTAESAAEEIRGCVDVHVVGLATMLDALRRHAPKARVFYAGSSHMFGAPPCAPQDETTPFAPRTPYAITKVAGAHLCATHREHHGMGVSVGILYNHESSLRGPGFLSRRLVNAALRAVDDPGHKIALRSLEAAADFGSAPDFIDARMRIVACPEAADFVVATGESHTVAEFAEAAFGAVGLDWRRHVEQAPRDRRESDAAAPSGAALVGDATKLRRATGWAPRLSFREMVASLVREAR